jgi:hypothetical protein
VDLCVVHVRLGSEIRRAFPSTLTPSVLPSLQLRLQSGPSSISRLTHTKLSVADMPIQERQSLSINSSSLHAVAPERAR